MLSGELRRVGRAGEPLSPRTVNLFLGSVTTALRAAVKRRLVGVNVGECVDRVESDPDAGADRGGWQLDQTRAFLAHLRETDHRLYAAFLLSLSGLRRGEVLGLTWEAVDLVAGTLTVRRNRVAVAGEVHTGTPKSRASRRTLPLPAPVVAALTALQLHQREEADRAAEAYDNPAGFVVVNELGQPYVPEWYSDEFTRQVRAAGPRGRAPPDTAARRPALRRVAARLNGPADPARCGLARPVPDQRHGQLPARRDRGPGGGRRAVRRDVRRGVVTQP
jgi:integrase